jgi:hypothetical protein
MVVAGSESFNLVTSHSATCGWRESSCPESFATYPNATPATIEKKIHKLWPAMISTVLYAIQVCDSSIVNFQTVYLNNIQKKEEESRGGNWAFELRIPGEIKSEYNKLLSTLVDELEVVKFQVGPQFAYKSVFTDENIAALQLTIQELLSTAKCGFFEQVGVILKAMGDWLARICGTDTDSAVAVMKDLVRVALILSLTGWSHISLLKADSASVLFEGIDDPANRRALGSHLVCEYCCRNIAVESFVYSLGLGQNTKEFQPLSQHRSFCPVVAVRSMGEHCNTDPGWKVICRSLQSILDHACDTSTEVKKRTLDENNNEATSQRSVNAFDIYKRVRKVLDMTNLVESNL